MRILGIAAAAAAAAALVGCASETDEVAVVAPSAPAHAVPAMAAEPDAAPAYVDEAAASDLYEIEAGRIALDHAASPDVKRFAQQMITDHTSSTNMIKAAIASAGLSITPPASLDPPRAAMLDKLNGVTGPDFDRLYLHQQLMAHEAALALHQNYAANGDVPALRGAAGQIVPVVQAHLGMLQSMGAA